MPQYLQDVIDKLWRGSKQFLVGYHGLEYLEMSTWPNITTEFRVDGIGSLLLFEKTTYLKDRRFESETVVLLQVSTFA